MWHWVAGGNIQQVSYIPHREQHSPFELMLVFTKHKALCCVMSKHCEIALCSTLFNFSYQPPALLVI